MSVGDFKPKRFQPRFPFVGCLMIRELCAFPFRAAVGQVKVATMAVKASFNAQVCKRLLILLSSAFAIDMHCLRRDESVGDDFRVFGGSSLCCHAEDASKC